MEESFFATLKNERVHRTVYPTRQRARADIAQYIELPLQYQENSLRTRILHTARSLRRLAGKPRSSVKADRNPVRKTRGCSILRLRYQGSADRWAIGIYLASDQRYTEAELPTSFGPKTGTPEQGIDHTFILYAGPSLQP